MKNGLVEMVNGEKEILVNIVAVEAHLQVGWELLYPDEEQEITAELQRRNLAAAAAASGFGGKLVKMSKTAPIFVVNPEETAQGPDEVISVDPSTVEGHLRAGWRVIDEDYLKAVQDAYFKAHPDCENPFHIHPSDRKVKATVACEIPPKYRRGPRQYFYFWSLCAPCYHQI